MNNDNHGEAVVDEDELPKDFNAAGYFIDRHLQEGRGEKTAYIDDNGSYTYKDLADATGRMGAVLEQLGLNREARVAMIMLDSFEFPVVFWGCIKAGVIPVAINTMLTGEHYQYILNDCRAQVLFVSDRLYGVVAPILEHLPHLREVIVSGKNEHGRTLLSDRLSKIADDFQPADTHLDEVAFWLYSSGSTGHPKGVRHRHAALYWTAKLYGRNVLGIREFDVGFSAPKLFFAYGLGNGMTFPLSVGATTILKADRMTPPAVMQTLKEHQPTLFFGVPTLYAAILADRDNDQSAGSERLRLCVSAGEALPEETGKAWKQRFGADILDGVGSTEMLHIYLSNQPGHIRYGTSGFPVPGYRVLLVDEAGDDVREGEIGELLVSGPSAAEGYWNQREKTLKTFVGLWTYTGDKYSLDEQGYYHYCGRSDDMFKSGGNWVSPFEVEDALVAHEKVLEAAVIPHKDESGNDKPKAYVVLKEGGEASDELVDELKQFVQSRIELWKYPRWIVFTGSLPKTATGKIQRFKLREADCAGQ